MDAANTATSSNCHTAMVTLTATATTGATSATSAAMRRVGPGVVDVNT
jgi:hypothetical protein